MATQFFSSDSHFFHTNIWQTFTIQCQHCSGTGQKGSRRCQKCKGSAIVPARPFTSNKEMHEYLIDSHNSVVKSSDKFYDLGDLTMIQHGNTLISALKKLVASRNGYQSIILGNHDRLKPVHYSEMFKKVRGSMRIDNLIFSHIPIHPSSIKRGCVNVHGHIHTQPVYLGPYINISVEAIDYTPVSLDELKSQAKKLLRKLDNA